MTIINFELIRIILALIMLGIASFLDIRKREVSDILWLSSGAVAGIIYIFDFPTTYATQIQVVISLSLTTAISFGIYKSGLFGGADALCLIVLAAILPTYNGQLSLSQATFHPISSLIVLSNAIILSLSGIIVNLVRNFIYSRNCGRLFTGLEYESPIRKTIALLIGYRTKKQPHYAFLIESIVDGKRKFDFSLKSAENSEYEVRSDVWVMPGMPLLIYMFAGFVIMLLAGDLMAIMFIGHRLA